MKAVGIKVLKNNLSRYLKEVQAGEIVWITDRDVVIAEMHGPTVPVPGKVDRWTAWVNAQVRAGRIRPAAIGGPSLRAAFLPAPAGARFDLGRILEETRVDRR